MPPRAKVTLLPPEIRAELDRRLERSGFGGYDALSAWLAEHDFEISAVTLSRYGKGLQQRVDAIRTSTQAAQLIAEAAPDTEDARSAAVISLVQTELFNSLVALREADEEADPSERLRLLTTAARSIADVSRASINIKRYQADVRQKAQAVAEAVTKTVKKGGLSAEAIDTIRREILGIAA